MSIENLRNYYNVPAKVGMYIELTDNFCASKGDKPWTAKIVGSDGQYLRIRFEGESRIYTVHPTWNVKYPEKT